MNTAGAPGYRSNEGRVAHRALAGRVAQQILNELHRMQGARIPQKLAETPASLNSFFSSPDPYFAFVSAPQVEGLGELYGFAAIAG